MSTKHTSPSYYRAVEPGRPWQPGFWTRLPWLAVGALTLSLLGTAAFVGILIGSHGTPISAWRFQPTVYLSIAYTITHITLTFALAEGVNIAWWSRAIKKEANIGDLHRIWAFGNNVWAASTSGHRFNLIALACLLVAINPVIGPLLQRASRVEFASITSQTMLSVPLTKEVPYGWTGYISGRVQQVQLLTASFTPIVQDYYNRATINTRGTGCAGLCSAKVPGAGFDVNCVSSESAFSLVSKNGSDLPSAQVFDSLFLFDANSAPANISLNVQYKKTSDCSGNLVVRNCTLQYAIVEYPVIIDGNQSTISLDPSSSIHDDTVVKRLDVGTESLYAPSTLGGVYLALNNRFDSTASQQYTGAVGYTLTTTGATANQYANTTKTSGSTSFVPANDCSLRFNDPLDDLLAEARELMFRTAVASANSSTAQQVLAQQTLTHAVYNSEYLFVIIATAISLIAVICVTLTFDGFWLLGRTTTMSPIETAKAFNAPMLQNEDSNANSSALLREIGDRRVQYGAVARLDAQAFASDASGTSRLDEVSLSTLEMAFPQSATAPQQGWKFGG